MEKQKKESRRLFLKTASIGAVAAMAAPAVLKAEPVIAPEIQKRKKGEAPASDRIRVAVLGVHGRGMSHVSEIMKLSETEGVELAAICDPDLEVLQKRAGEIQAKYGKTVQTFQDFRKLYEDPNIHAVTLGTPNHWHALQTIWACQAGKDVYVEKPGTHNIYEGKKVIEAAYKYNRIVQHGVQLRSNAAVREGIKYLHDGLIGKVYMARGLVFRSRPSIGDKGISPVPSTLNYDLWCGPAPMVPFTRNLVHYNWHWHWNYGNGDVGNQGIHETDACMWGLGVDKLPNRITAMGGKFLWDDCKECPEVLTSVYHYPDEGKIIQFEVRPWYTNAEDGVTVGNIFYGEKGYMLLKHYSGYEFYLGSKKEKGPARSEGGELTAHFKNWFDAIKARDMSIQNGPVQSVHLSSALAHLGNISYRLGLQLEFDPVAERFIGNGENEANAMLKDEYRAPYLLPETV